jgi:DNA-binding transcriptional regulator YdaS (Cro superfamily)
MDNLKTYLHAERGRIQKVASAMGWARAYLSQIAHGRRPLPVDRAAELEALSDGAVRRWESFPDTWHRIWPELVGTPGAPALPAVDAPAGTLPPPPQPGA